MPTEHRIPEEESHAIDTGALEAAWLSRPSRLLIVTTVSTTTRAFLLPFADRFRSLGWKVDALSHGIEACGVCRPHFDEVHDIEWSRNPLEFSNMSQAIRRVRAVVADGLFDIVHVHTPIASFVTRMALSLSGRRRPVVVYTAHGFHFQPGNSWLRNTIIGTAERIAGRWTDFLITINRTDEAAAARLHLVPPDRLLFMPGIGVDLERFRPLAVPQNEVQSVRRRFGIGDDEPVFTMIAEFIPRKRYQDAIAALSRMRNRNAHLICVGDGPTQAAVEKQAADSGLLDRVHFAGFLDDVRPYILAARAVVLPSFQEGLPRSLMESLACGVPAIGSDIRGTRDLLADGGGIIFPTGDVAALASGLDWFADNPAKAADMGGRARTCLDKYNIANIIALHEELYARALANSARESGVTASRSRTSAVTRPPILAVVTVDIMAWVLVRQWLEGLQQAGFEVHIACSRGKYFRKLADAGFIMHPVRLRRTFNVFAHVVPFFELIKVIRSRKFQIVNTHSPVAAAIGRLAAVFSSVDNILYTVHGFYFHDGMFPGLRFLFIALEWLLGRWTDAFMFLSDEDRTSAERLGICGTNARVCTIYNGVDVEKNSPLTPSGSAAARIERGFPDRPVVGVVGRIVREKGYREFLRMAVSLTQAGIDATYLVVGDSLPSDRDRFGPEFRSMVVKAGLQDRFIFTGQTDSVPDYLRLMDIFVLPSYREGFPRSILEAMATGLPVVATNIRGSREAVIDGVTGLLVPPRDGRALSTAVEALLADPELRKRMGDAARRTVLGKYDFRNVREKFVAFVRAVYGRVPTVAQKRIPVRRFARWLAGSLTFGAIVLMLYVVPNLIASALARDFHNSLFLVIFGNLLDCLLIGFLIGWRWAGGVYLGLAAIKLLCIANGIWTPNELVWLSNLVPMLVVAAWLSPALGEARNWRRRKDRAVAGTS